MYFEPSDVANDNNRFTIIGWTTLRNALKLITLRNLDQLNGLSVS